MHIAMITPAPPTSLKGNGVTAQRWASILEDLGHSVQFGQRYEGQDCDVLVALHARRSANSVRRFHELHPDKPAVVALTGTDLYDDLKKDPDANHSLQLATCIIVLQSHGLGYLAPHLQAKSHVILQSATPARSKPPALRNVFEVCVASHLRAVKDPLRTAHATRHLPKSSKICVSHYGLPLDEEIARRAVEESEENPRYRWFGPVSNSELKSRIVRSRIVCLTSKLEGGANVVAESLVCGVPVISSRISGSLGMLGEDYPGYFEVGATQQLTDLMCRVESDAAFYEELVTRCDRLAHRFQLAAERNAWEELLERLAAL